MLGDKVTKALRSINDLGPVLEDLVDEMRVLRELIDEMRTMRDQLGEVTLALHETRDRLDRTNELAEDVLRRADGATDAP